MRAATLTIEPAAGALHVRLDVPERDVGEALAREFRQRVDMATLRALEESAGALFRTSGGAGFAGDARRAGMMLYRTLVPEALRDDLRAVRTLVVASSMTGLPWELVHDGDDFWGLRYALGTRLVLDRSATVRPPAHKHDRPRALVVGADPAGDLPHLTREIDAVCDALESRAEIVCVADRLASVDRLLTYLGEGFDVIHFAGHVVTDDAGRPALLLGDGSRVPASVLEANVAGRPLVYVNGCTSAHTAATTASVAHAFLHGGALAVVGTIADVADEHAATLATAFYREALGGASLGNALREARAEVRERAPASAAWLSVVLYGSPAHGVLRDETAKVVPIRAAEPTPPTVRLPAAARRMPRWPWLVVALVVLLALAARYGRDWLAPNPGPVTVGVMDVRARTAAVPDWMRTLTRDSLNTVLSHIPEVQVFSRHKIDFLREKRGLTEIEAAEQLGMRKLLGATIGLDAGQVTIEVEVVDIASGMLDDTARVQGPEASLLDLQTELALRVLTALGVQPSAEDLREIAAERRDATVEAYRLLSETLGGGRKPRDGSAPPPTTPPSPGPGSSWLVPGARAWAQAPDHEEVAIRELLRRYALALQAKQTEALAVLQVEMDDAQRASLARYFAIATNLVVQVRAIDILIEGADAVVTFTREDTFIDAPSGRAMRLEVRVSGRLVKREGAWKIHRLGDPS